ncbi:MAG: CHAT domain-containing protein [Chloroflexi bacterium]|nr:MAG: CHAT domain-containing protein [Chloroflexota bacterium]
MAGQPLTYRDFNIEITEFQDDGAFKVRVIGQTPGGEMRAADAETVTYIPGDFSRLLGKLERRKATQDELFELGKKLAGLLLPGRVGELYNDSLKALAEGEGLRLRLRIEPLALAALPWEYTYVQRTAGEKVPSDFLALQRRVSITRYETIGPSLRPLEGKDRIRIVAALASPIDERELDLDADRQAIAAAIAELKDKAQDVEAVMLEPATRDALLSAISGADIFHFAGHGVFEGTELTPDGKVRKKGKIILETEDNESDRYDSAQLATNLGNAGVRLVVLGACNSAARDEGGAWTGVAPALVRENIPAVVAMQYKVRDRNAARFMAYLYARVLGGHTIDEAVFEGRQAIFTHAGLEDRDWGVPVLYLRAADGILFPLPTAEAGVPDSPVVVVQRRLGTVRGQDIGAKIGEMLSGRLEVRDVIDVVEAGGTSIGVEIDRLGG